MNARVVVTGGRNYGDRKFVEGQLDLLHAQIGIGVLVHGDASGADRLARDWARSRGVPDEPHPAQWGKIEGIALSDLRRNRRGDLYNPRAGFIRNKEMLEAGPTHALAFPGGNGTADMCKRIFGAKHRGQPIHFFDLRDIG